MKRPQNLKILLHPNSAPLERQCRHQGWVLPDPKRWEDARVAMRTLQAAGVLADSDVTRLERRLIRALASTCAPITYS